MADKPSETASGQRSDETTPQRRGGFDPTLLILAALAVVGVIVTLVMGTRNFEVAGVSAPAVVPFLWYMFVGFIFTTIGAAGGNLAAVGHISVLGLQNANTIKPMSQITTLVTPFSPCRPTCAREGWSSSSGSCWGWAPS